jgi:hypothetical protein
MRKNDLLKKYDHVHNFHNGFVCIKKDGKYGFVNENFEESKVIYDKVYNFSNGFAVVKLNDKYGLINEKFEESEIKYDYVSDFENRFSVIKIGQKLGFINYKFKETEIKYDKIYDFSNGFARVKYDDKWGFVDWMAEEVSQDKVLSTLSLMEDEYFYWFKKILKKDLTSLFFDFQYSLNKEYEFEIDKNIYRNSAKGFNLATEELINESFNSETQDIYIVKVQKKDNTIIIPTDTSIIRCKKAFLTDYRL